MNVTTTTSEQRGTQPQERQFIERRELPVYGHPIQIPDETIVDGPQRVNAPSRRVDTLGLVFQALLGAAACLILVAVVQQATASAATVDTSVDAPPPAVFVQTDE